MTAARLICMATAISLLAGCGPGKLSRADEEDLSCLLATLAGFSTAKKLDPDAQSPVARALVQSAFYRVGRLQGRHGDNDWPRLIDQLDPSVMQVPVAEKLRTCSQDNRLGSAMTNPELRAALQRLAEREPRSDAR